MIRILPSILAADCTRLGECIKEAERGGCDYIHIDIMDGMFVPNLSFGIPIVEACRRSTDIMLDVHLMIEQPERYIDKFKSAGADFLTVHYEACKSLRPTLLKIHDLGMKTGVSIKPDTPVSVLKDVFDLTDMFLIMTVEPGFGGQKYMDKCTGKIIELRRMLDEAGLDTAIEVDGGITRDNISVVVDAGATDIVMGSALFKGSVYDNVRYFKEKYK